MVLLMAHARRYHCHYHTTGHVWQGRFQAFPVQDDDHLVTVLRYVERNALRAELVARAEDWKWSSLPAWLGGDGLLWRDIEVRPEGWLERVNEPLSAGDIQRLRLSVDRGETLRPGVVDDRDGASVGPGIDPALPRTTTKDR